MAVVESITKYLPDGGEKFLEEKDVDPTQKKIKLAKERLKKAHEYRTANAVVPCPYLPDSLHLNEDNALANLLPEGAEKIAKPHPPHAAPCPKCHQYHALARTDLAKAVAETYLAQITGGDDPLKPAMADSEIPGKMAGVLICVDPKTGDLKVIKAHSGPGLGADFSDLDGYAGPLDRTPDNAQALAEKRQEREDLPDSAKLSSEERNDLNVAAEEADDRIKELAGAAFDAENPAPSREDLLKMPKQERNQVKRTRVKERKAAISVPRKQALKPDAGPLAASDDDTETQRELKAAQRDYRAKTQAADEAAASYEDCARIDSEIAALEKKQLVGTFVDDKTTDIADTCVTPTFEPASPEGNCGVCAAPKLLKAAQENDLIPVSIAEFWVGTEVKGWKEGAYIDSCVECMKFIGSMMCGIEEKSNDAPFAK